MAGDPVVRVFGFAFEQAALGHAPLERLEFDAHVRPGVEGRRQTELLQLVVAEIRMEPLEVNGVGGIVHTLQPVARQPMDLYDHVEVVTRKQIPTRQRRRRQRPQIGEDKAAEVCTG